MDGQTDGRRLLTAQLYHAGWFKKATLLSTNVNIVPYKLQNTKYLYTVLATLTFAINYSQFKWE